MTSTTRSDNSPSRPALTTLALLSLFVLGWTPPLLSQSSTRPSKHPAVNSPHSAGPGFTHPEGSLIPVRDTRVWVEKEGHGEPLILLPGGPANSHVSFHPYFSALADQHQIIYYDYRGRGRSGRP